MQYGSQRASWKVFHQYCPACFHSSKGPTRPHRPQTAKAGRALHEKGLSPVTLSNGYASFVVLHRVASRGGYRGYWCPDLLPLAKQGFKITALSHAQNNTFTLDVGCSAVRRVRCRIFPAFPSTPDPVSLFFLHRKAILGPIRSNWVKLGQIQTLHPNIGFSFLPL